MFITELDTFVKKFHQLWNYGITAHLDLDMHAGDVWVGLRVPLGQVPGPLHRVHSFHQEVPIKESPSRQRRRARRAAVRQASTTNTARQASTSNTEVVEAEGVVEETTLID